MNEVSIPSQDGTLPTITVTEDEIHNKFICYIKSDKYDDIVILMGNRIWAYCIPCKKYISYDSSNIRKHYLALHVSKDNKLFIHEINKILKLMIELNAPNTIVEKQVFRNVFPNFPKDRKTFTKNFDEMYLLTKDNIIQYLNVVNNINLYIDEWTRFDLNFVGIFCSTEKKDALLACGVPKDISRRSDDLAKYIKKIVNSFKINNKINFCSSDCARNMINAIIKSNYTWFPCCCHVVNKAVEKAFRSIPEINTICQKVTSLTASTKFKQYLLSIDAGFWTIPSFSQTRWLSIGTMFKRLKDYHDTIKSYINSEYNINQIYFNDIEWTSIFILSDIIDEMNQCIKDLESKSKSGFFFALLYLLKIIKIISPKFKNNGYIEAYELINNYIINKIRNNKEWAHHLFLSAILNPNINLEKDEVVPEEIKEFYSNAINEILCNITVIEPQSINLDNFGMREVNNNENQYVQYKKLPYPGNVDVVDFWEQHKLIFPNLYKLARKYIGLYPSSACIERTFSMAKSILSDKYGGITPKNAEKRIFLYVNEDFTPDE